MTKTTNANERIGERHLDDLLAVYEDRAKRGDVQAYALACALRELQARRAAEVAS